MYECSMPLLLVGQIYRYRFFFFLLLKMKIWSTNRNITELNDVLVSSKIFSPFSFFFYSTIKQCWPRIHERSSTPFDCFTTRYYFLSLILSWPSLFQSTLISSFTFFLTTIDTHQDPFILRETDKPRLFHHHHRHAYKRRHQISRSKSLQDICRCLYESSTGC